ncbi:MAG: hypothetical protein IJL62_01805 [Clostridia bacterium]|nr:hypothetical protein [Clostridia bacterium]
MKRTVITILLLLTPMILCAETDEVQDGIDALLETIDLKEWDAWFRRNDGDDALLPSELLKQLAETQSSVTEMRPDRLLSRMLPSLKTSMAKATLLLGLAVLGASVRGVSEASPVAQTAQTAFRICAAAAVLILVLAEIRSAVRSVSDTEHTAELLLPAIVGFLSLGGMENTALLLPASFTLLSDVVLKLTETCVVPMSIVGGVLLALDAGGTGRLGSIGKLLQRAAKWILGTACSFYLIVTAVRSVAAGSADGLLMKTTKFAAGSIPSIGSLLSESVDTAFRCMHFVRNALGLTGCVVLLSLALKPVLSIALTRGCLRAASLLSEPLAGKPYADLLRGVGDTLHILMLSELAALAMSLVMLAPVFYAGGTL